MVETTTNQTGGNGYIRKPYLDCQSITANPIYTALAFLIPIVIIVIMQIYSRIKKGKFTAQPPFLFLLDNDRNRLLTITTFGFLS